ncbi:hypothetical protein MA6G0125R_1541 [Mycobacteroides abscessus 6G-0125-R]|nr:hypothetical protein MA6G0125R_1541 [Mycobacteroides abscessus 6G-0125-R]ETZ60844.1 hypothetical protein L836_2267 [Mycobacteroides abscessus MAB_110811_2726]
MLHANERTGLSCACKRIRQSARPIRRKPRFAPMRDYSAR